jgi:hypothetical protein
MAAEKFIYTRLSPRKFEVHRKAVGGGDAAYILVCSTTTEENARRVVAALKETA